MKRNTLKVLAGIIISLGIINACNKDDEPFSQVSAFERGIQNSINDYRASIGKPSMVLQFLLIDNAQAYSAKMANESVSFGFEGVMPDLEEQKVLLGADSSAAWVAYCEYEHVDSVMNIVLKDPATKTKIEGYFNQSAVGAVKDANGHYYITGLMLHFK